MEIDPKTPVTAERLDDIIAEQAAQQQLLIMALRRIAALTRAQKLDPAKYAAHWKMMGERAVDQIDFAVAAGHLAVVRAKTKRRLANMIDIGMREPAVTPPSPPRRLARRGPGTAR